jgi:hypothetical protein
MLISKPHGLRTFLISGATLLLLTNHSLASESGKKLGTSLGTFTVKAGSHQRLDVPIPYQCRLDDLLNGQALSVDGDHHLILEEQGGQKSKIDAQWEPEAGFEWDNIGNRGTLLWILEGTTETGSTRTFKLMLKNGPRQPGSFAVEDIQKKHLLIQKNSRPILRYNYGIVRRTEGEAGPYDRAAYIHPVWTPTGKVVSGDFSPEHVHQRGIFFAAHAVKFGAVQANFWELGQENGRTLPDALNPKIITGPVFAELVIHNKGTVDGQIRFKEVTMTRVYSLPRDDFWLFDIRVRQVPVDPNQPNGLPEAILSMEWQQVLYGGMAFRGASEWLPKEVRLDVLTSEGKDRIGANTTSARWIDYTGPLGNEWGGLVIFDHPANPCYPTPLRVHAELPYFCCPFFQNKPYIVYGNRPLDLTYRFLIHNGHPNRETNERIANDFSNPPEVTWEAAKVTQQN